MVTKSEDRAEMTDRSVVVGGEFYGRIPHVWETFSGTVRFKKEGEAVDGSQIIIPYS